MSSVQRSYGWQQSAGAARRAAARTAAADRRRSDRARHQLVQLAAGARCTDPRTAAPCPAAAARAPPPRSRRRSPRARRDARERSARSSRSRARCVVARDGCSSSGAISPVSRLKRTRRRALAADGPELVAQVLLDERDLGLHRELDVGQRASAPGPRRDAGENPGRALLVHQAARAVDRIDDDRQRDVRSRSRRRAARPRRRAALRRRARTGASARGDRPLDLLDEHVLGDAVDRVDRVAFVVVRDVRRARSPPRARTRATTSSRMRRCSARIGCEQRVTAGAVTATSGRTGSAARRRRRSSAAFSSGEVSLRKLPPPISGPARYFSRFGRRSGGWNSMWKWKPRASLRHRRLVQRHHVRERHPPQVVEADHDVAEHRREIAPLVVVEVGNASRRSAAARRRPRRRSARSTARTRSRCRARADDPPAVLALGGDDVLEQQPAGLVEVPRGRRCSSVSMYLKTKFVA